MIPVLRRLHMVVGLTALVAFMLTGQYMDRALDHLEGMADAPRMIYRSAHIYLLWSGLLNSSLGVYLQPAPSGWRRGLQALGSALLLIGAPLLLVAFVVEPGLAELERPWARPALYSALAGVVSHLVAHIGSRRAAPVSRDTVAPGPKAAV